MSTRARIHLILLLSLAVTALALSLPPVPQPPEYHSFADQRVLFGIPNGLNVLSNLPFLLVGGAGLVLVLRNRRRLSPQPLLQPEERWCYLVLFAGVALTCFGSAHYHLAPDNPRLAWDRLPMSVGFTALVAAMVAERIDPRVGRRLLVPLVLAGIGSVIYWRWSEAAGTENLVPYVAVQFWAIVLVLLIVLLFGPRYDRGRDFLTATGIYAVAKVAEYFDREVNLATGFISGHALKHLLAALAILWILRMLWKRVALGGHAGVISLTAGAGPAAINRGKAER